ncbi:MAG TPA: TolC family protein [Caulobacteraceae bacterium]|nr:TolC family protein [Caulobacteraceae bacterium]
MPEPDPSRRRIGAAIAACAAGALALAGCASYRPAPLPSAADLATGADALTTDVAALRVAPLSAITIDPSNGFTPLDVAVLAVLNSPDLKARRAALGVPAAQVFAAGLLPDPQISLNLDRPIAGPDHATAYGVSPALDIAGLLAVADNERAARFTARQANLDELWAEWTTAQEARQLAETVLTDEARAAFLRDILRVAADRADRSSKALGRGDVTAPAAAADVAAKLDAGTALASAEHDAAKARRDLNALIGLDASVALPLRHDGAPVADDAAAVAQTLASLPQRRPDLLALQAGYGAEDAKLRQAIVAQFPLAQIAFAYARDPTPTTTLGLAAVVALPIFNGQRGAVRVEEATRAQLRAEYQARLDQTDAEVRDAAAELESARAQAAVLRADLPRLEAMLAPAPAALARGDLDSGTYLALVQTVVSKQADLEDRELTARMAEIQLETSLFVPPQALAGAS